MNKRRVSELCEPCNRDISCFFPANSTIICFDFVRPFAFCVHQPIAFFPIHFQMLLRLLRTSNSDIKTQKKIANELMQFNKL